MLNQTLFNIIIFGIILYLFFKNKSLEKMTETASAQNIVSPENLLAIKNLGELAAQLKNGGDITIPGNLTITGKLTVSDPNKNSKVILDIHDKGTDTSRGYIRLQHHNDKLASSLYQEGDGGLYVYNNNRNITVDGTLNVNDSAEFGRNEGRKLRIVSSKFGDEQTYLAFFNGDKRSSYIMPHTSGDITIANEQGTTKNLNVTNLRASGATVTGNLQVDGRIKANGDVEAGAHLAAGPNGKVRFQGGWLEAHGSNCIKYKGNDMC